MGQVSRVRAPEEGGRGAGRVLRWRRRPGCRPLVRPCPSPFFDRLATLSPSGGSRCYGPDPLEKGRGVLVLASTRRVCVPAVPLLLSFLPPSLAPPPLPIPALSPGGDDRRYNVARRMCYASLEEWWASEGGTFARRPDRWNTSHGSDGRVSHGRVQ